MNLIQDYTEDNSSNTSEEDTKELQELLGMNKINPTPEVALVVPHSQQIDSLNKHIVPFTQKNQNEFKLPTGKVEKNIISEDVFREQFYNFKKYGVFMDPEKGGDNFIEKNQHGDHFLDYSIKKRSFNEMLLGQKSVYARNSKEEKEKRKKLKVERVKGGDASSGDFLGPWAPYKGEEEFQKEFELTQEQMKNLEEIEERRKEEIEKAEKEEEFTFTSTFHIENERDYQGKSYIRPDYGNVLNGNQTYYIPKKMIHIYKGHTKGVLKSIFYPKYGHFLLTSSFDTTVKLWEVNQKKRCVATFRGHKGAVKDICFTNDGLHFLSTSFDDRVNYWDTETGQVVKSFKLEAHPFCGKFHPDEDKQHTFLVGDMQKSVKQFDLRTNEQVQSYSEHLGPVNTITFVDGNRKFASTSDDKKVFLWEFGIPIVVKHISDPEMHAISATDRHPNDKYFLGQSSDNRILCFDVKAQTIRLNKKKKFMGHLSSGYAVGVRVSPDGQFVASGDHNGRVFFYDWKSTKVFSVLEAHNNVCVGLDWHPNDPSRFVTSSWDGLVKLWST